MKRSKRRRWSGIFQRYCLITCVILLTSFFVMGITMMVFVSQYINNRQVDLLQQNAANLAVKSSELKNTSFLLADGDSAVEAQFHAIFSIIFITTTHEAIDADVFIYDAQGRVTYCYDLISSQTPMSGNCPIHSSFQISAETMRKIETQSLEGRGKLDGNYEDTQFLGSAPIMIDGQMQGAVVVAQDFSLHVSNYTRKLAMIFVWAACISLLLAFVAIYFITYQLTRPLTDMSKAAKQYAKGDFSNRIRYRPWGVRARNRDSDELAQLVQDFNSMASSLSILESTRRSFVANVSHELKTPMTTIGGFIDGILDGTVKPEEERHYLAIVSSEVKRLARLVTGMLNMSKMEAGEMQLTPASIDITQMCFDTLLTFEQVLEEKRVDVRGFEQMGSFNVWADPDMIHQVLYNLIDNAVKFVQEGGYIAFSCHREDGTAHVSVKNSGAGIAEEEINNVFERFYKVDKSRSFDTRGAGLGLYIIKSIVELHGGQISVNSIPNVYTEFSFRLPEHPDINE